MTITLLLLALATALATMLGGIFALRFQDKSHLILGFSAGAVMGVAFFELLPEAISLSGNFSSFQVFFVVAIGFGFYLIIDRFFHSSNLSALHFHDHSQICEHEYENKNRGTLRAGSLSIHSFLDGLGIGLAFQVSPVLGFVVAVAVLAHDFSDGINTVSAIIKSGGDKVRALRWLTADALAPVAGIISTMFFSIPQDSLGLILALFAGFFLYMGASDLVPESFHAHPTKWTTLATILGAFFVAILVSFAR